jgi:antagonist of KipI
MEINIIRPGILTTLQDQGRTGYQSLGVTVGGAMDGFAHRMANILLGNEENLATIEFTTSPAEVRLSAPGLFSICGAGMTILADGQPIPLWRAFYTSKPLKITLKPNKNGARIYFAVAGGWACKSVMNSAATCLSAGFGGYKGRTLQADDTIESGNNFSPINKALRVFFESLNKKISVANWGIIASMMPMYRDNPVIRVVRGPENDWFNEAFREKFFDEAFTIGSLSNRMAYRLESPFFGAEMQQGLISTAVSPGMIQVTPAGEMILLMADCQTTGGYPRIARVASVDLPLCVQLKPGDQLRFTEISPAEAEILYLKQEAAVMSIKQSIAIRFSA